jgi:hypothetical protein
MLSDSQYVNLSIAIHTLEDATVRLPSTSTALKLVAFGLPVAVLLHDLSHWWLPKRFSLPVVSFFRRRWVSDPSNKMVDLMTFRNLALFFGIAAIMHDGVPRVAPIDYLSDRLTSTTARRQIDRDIAEKRTQALEAANRVMAAHAFDDTKATALREEAVIRRWSKERDERDRI